MNRTQRGLKTAAEAAQLSTHSRYRLGAALFLGRRLISIGWNQNKTHPTQQSIFRWQHAELSCLIGVNKKNLSNATMYVVRIIRNGSYRVSKPCGDCQRILRATGLRKVVYINRQLKIKTMRM